MSPLASSFSVLTVNCRSPFDSCVDSIDCIEDQVENHLLQLDPIAKNQGQADRELRSQSDVASVDLAACELDNFRDYVVDIQWASFRRVPSRETPHAPDYFAGPICIIDDSLNGLFCLRQVRGFACQPA